MSSKDSNTPSVSDDYQIIDASCFKVEDPEPGLEFNLNIPCPVCTSFKSKLICANCIQSGSFSHSQRHEGSSYLQLCDRLSTVTKELKLLNNNLLQRSSSFVGPIKDLEILIESLGRTVEFHAQKNEKKEDRRNRSRKLLQLCQTQRAQLKKNYSDLSRHFSKITNQRSIFIRDFEKSNADIERLRFIYLKELLQTHLVVDLSPETNLPDKFAGSTLYIDKKNILIGPEPRLASHAALTYCVPTINAASLFEDMWLPKAIHQHLQLSGPFLSSLPQRDNLGRIYSAALHAIHMLCSRRGIIVRSVLDELGVPSRQQQQQSEFNPLYGLYCLARHHRSGHFDGPFAYLLDGFFGAVKPPELNGDDFLSHLTKLHLGNVEQGEEVKDVVTDESLLPTKVHHEFSSYVNTTTLLPEEEPGEHSGVCSAIPSSSNNTNSEFDPWEVIASVDASQTVVNSTHQS